MKSPLTLVAVLAAALCAATPAQAQRLDLSTIKCKEFVNSAKDNIALKPGGAYSMKLNSKSVAFVVDADAAAGTGPVLSRLVSLR